MRIQTTLIFLSVLSGYCMAAQSVPKITGPLGEYDMISGYSYSDTTGRDSVLMQTEIRIGEPCIANQGLYMGFSFRSAVDSSIQWGANRVFGIIQPLTEDGVYDQIADTAVYTPYFHTEGPGMIQGGQRFSRLSQLYGGFSGVILDDWNGDTSAARQIRDAVRGKYVDAEGNVHSECIATTPYNKLYCVLYSDTAIPSSLPVIDGVYYSLFQAQNCCYTGLDSDITQLRANFPHKEIMIAIYLQNSYLGWTDPAGVQYMLAHALDRYDDGDIDQVNIFAGIYLLKENITLDQWNAYALPHWLDSLYYPYLGAGMGRVYDCSTGYALTGASVRAFCQGRLSGDTFMRSYQMTDADGQYRFGLWAGNRSTDSTRYWLVAEMPGYISDTVEFWTGRGDTSFIPDLGLCPGINGTTASIQVYPNPGIGYFTIEMAGEAVVNREVGVYDMMGRRVYSAPLTSASAFIDISGCADGVYLVAVSDIGTRTEVARKRILLLR